MFARLGRFLQLSPETQKTLGVRAPWRVFWVAFLIRLAFMTITHQYRVRTFEGYFQFGWEAGRIARALVTGYGYADPFSNAYMQHTGPTAWLPPIYPLLLAGVFKLFGVYTLLSGWVVLAINCVLSASTAMATWEIGARVANRRVGLWAGWLFALYPAFMQYAVKWIWEMTLTTFLFSWVFVLTLRMRSLGDEDGKKSNPTIAQWILFGLIWAAIGLTNSTLLAFLPFAGIWILLPTWRQPRALTGAILAGIVFLAAIAPWTIRNTRVFHTFIPLRGNFGAEMYLGNGPGSSGLLMGFDHPFLAPDQLHLYARMGEVKYVAMRYALARDYIHQHPMHFVSNIAKRTYFFWASVPHPWDHGFLDEFGRTLNFCFLSLCGLMGLGLAMYRKLPAAWLFFWAFLLLPIPYYLVTVHARFRHPLEPLICVLGAYLFQSAEKRKPMHPAPQN
jgi:hypothetical protein